LSSWRNMVLALDTWRKVYIQLERWENQDNWLEAPPPRQLTWPWCSRLVATSGTSASCRPKTRITAVHTTLSLTKQPQPP
jgi:hypothetical protein